VIEPFLMHQGFLQRTPRGRVATLAAYRHLGIARRGAQAACSRTGAKRAAPEQGQSAAKENRRTRGLFYSGCWPLHGPGAGLCPSARPVAS
jgi:hypothetical protein